MPTSATGRATDRRLRRSASGLTLIELVVVIAIMSVLALPAMLRMGAGDAFGNAPAPQRAAERLRDDLTRMRDRALFGRQVMGLEPAEAGWTFLTRADGGNWQPAGPEASLDGLDLSWQMPLRRPDADGPPPIVILPDGRATPFQLRIGNGPGALNCRFDGGGELACTSL